MGRQLHVPLAVEGDVDECRMAGDLSEEVMQRRLVGAVLGVTGAAVASTVSYGISLTLMLRQLQRTPAADQATDKGEK